MTRSRELAELATAYDGGGLGVRNRIINGDMRIDQRNAGASVDTSNTTGVVYTLDRWAYRVLAASKFTIQRNAGAITPPAGFTNYLGCTSSSSYSVTSGDVFTVWQPIEGFNTADLAFGTASAQSVTVSFWVRSSLTGTFSGACRNNAANRSYVFTYSISAANTWEYKTVTIAGDTTGTWETGNNTGLFVQFSLGVGSTYSTTAGAWQAGNFFGLSSATSVVGTSGATFYITGVQLEAGSVATPFERRPYGTELALCQRYFYREQGGTLIYGTIQSGSGSYESASLTGAFPVPMRVAPSLSFTGDRGYFLPVMASVTPSADVPNAAPSSGAPSNIVVGPFGISRANMPTNGLVRGVQYRNACFEGGTLACSAEL